MDIVEHLFQRRRFLAWCGAGMCGLLAGCEPESLGFTEVKRIHEVVTPAEFAQFTRIVDQLPEKRVPAFPSVFLPPPQWKHDRTLPVRDLYEEELRRREEGWDTQRMAAVFDRHKILTRELRKEKLTSEQFAGMVLTLGAAMCRNDVDEEVDLSVLSERARPMLDDLMNDLTPFSSLSHETQFAVLQKSMWIARKIRADKLMLAPLENRALAQKHSDWLANALPHEFQTNPIDETRDLLEERGMPFEELPHSGYDENIRWQQAGQPAPKN